MSDPTQRAEDDTDSQAFKRRKLAMSHEGPALIVNGRMGQARVIAGIVKDLGIGTVLILIVVVAVVGWLSGWIPFPLANWAWSYITSHEHIAQTVSEMDLSLKEYRDERKQELRVAREAWLIICENMATTRQATQNCQRIRALD